MSSTAIHRDDILRDHFHLSNTNGTSTHEPVSFRPVSYGQRTGKLMPPERLLVPLERRSTVHFDDEPAPHYVLETATPVKKSTSTSNSSAASFATTKSTTSAMPRTGVTTRTAFSAHEACDSIELTAVDKKWGRLFEIDGKPTRRFVEVMHSLAQYILHAFPSSENVVLVPSKLASFYNFHRVSSDPFHYQTIFQSTDRDQNRRLAELYQDLGCSYHLVQADPGSQPRIPGLTPDGFMRWMVLHLQAFPDGVFRRLDRVISDFPLDVVSVLDGRTERLPKQLSRYLLPRAPDGHIRSLLQQAVKRHFGEAALLAFSIPNEKLDRPVLHTSQSCPTSPSFASFPSSTSSTTSAPPHSQPRRQNSRHERRPEQVHRASDPGTMMLEVGKLLTSLHRRHASYPGPHSAPRTQGESANDHRGRERESRRHRSPSRARCSRHGTEHEILAHSVQSSDKHRSHRRHHSMKDTEWRSMSRDSPRRSSSRPGHANHGGSDTRRNEYPPSPLSATHASSSIAAPRARESSRPTTATNTSARRAPSPKTNEFRVSLPEIHHMDRSQHSVTREPDFVRTTRDEERIVDADRRVSCTGLPTRESTHSRSSASTVDRRGHISDDNTHRGGSEIGSLRIKAREHRYRMVRRVSGSGEDKNYRLHGSSLTTSPLSSAPVLQYSSSSASISPHGERSRRSSVVAESEPGTEKAAVPQNTSSPRRLPSRPKMSLSATVTTLENELNNLMEDGGSESDQTWDDYLRSSPHVAPVS